MGYRRIAAIVVLLMIGAGAYFWLTRGDSDKGDAPEARPLAVHGVFTKIEDAERAAGFKIPIVRELNGWKLKKIEVSPQNLLYFTCQPPQDCKGTPALPHPPPVSLEYEPPAPGPTFSILVVSAKQAGAYPPPRNANPVDVPEGQAWLREEAVIEGRVTSLSLTWFRPGYHIFASATFITNPSDPAYERGLLGKYSTDEFLAMMRSVR